MAEENTMLDYAAQKFAPEQAATTTEETVIVPETTAETTDAPQATEIVAETTQEAVIETQAQAPDYSKFLTENSDGLFNDLDSFKAALPKIKEYDSLLTQKTELEEKLKVSPYANEFSKTVDELIRAGKNPDEIENFFKISKVDIDALSPLDAKVMRMVKDGYNETIARSIVEDEYPINDEDLSESQKSILNEKLRVSAIEDKNVLKEFKKELTAVDNSAQVQAEQNRLAAIAQAEQHKQAVKQNVPKIVQAITGLGEINVGSGKEGEEEVKQRFDYPDDFKASLPSKIEAFFIDGNMPITDENVALAQKYIKADYLEQNFENIAKQIHKTGYSLGAEAMVNKYENRTGIATETTNPAAENVDKAYGDFLSKIAKAK